MDSAAGLNNASNGDMIMGVLYGVTAVVLFVTAYVLFTKRFRKQKMQALDNINFVTAKYNIYNENAQLLIEVFEDTNVNLDLLDSNENQVKNLLNGDLDPGEHIVMFNPKLFPAGQYFFNLTTKSTSIIKKIKIT